MNRVEIKNKAKTIVQEKFKEIWKGELIVVGISFLISFVISLLFNEESLIGMALNLIASLFTATLSVGLICYMLKLVREEEYSRQDLFKYIGEVLPIAVISLLVTIFTFFWSLLFIIPGIIAALSYTMVYYLYVDIPGKQPMEYLSLSKRLMDGYKLDYFVFILSFLGWILLSLITLGIALIYVVPYLTTAEVLYYDELSKAKEKELKETL